MEHYEDQLQMNMPVHIIKSKEEEEEKTLEDLRTEEQKKQMDEWLRREQYMSEVKNKLIGLSGVKPWEKVKVLKSTSLKVNNEYGSKYKEKFLFKSRESKFTNVKSRLYRKQENARAIQDIPFQNRERLAKLRTELPDDVQTMVDHKTLVNLSAFFGEDNAENEKLVRDFAGEGTNEDAFETMTNKLMEIDISKIDLANDEKLVENADKLEKMSSMISAYNDMTSGGAFREQIEAGGKELKKFINHLTNVSNYYRARKLVITHPYYKTHYNDEISLEAKQTDSNDKQVLSELISASLYYAKQCEFAGFNEVRTKKGIMPDIAALERKHRQMRDAEGSIKCEYVYEPGDKAEESIKYFRTGQEAYEYTNQKLTHPKQANMMENLLRYFEEKYGDKEEVKPGEKKISPLDRSLGLNLALNIPGAGSMGITLIRIIDSYAKFNDYYSESEWKEILEKFMYSHRKDFNPDDPVQVDIAKKQFNEGLLLLCDMYEDTAYKMKNTFGNSLTQICGKDEVSQDNTAFFVMSRQIQDINVMVAQIYPYLERQGIKVPAKKREEIGAIGGYYATYSVVQNQYTNAVNNVNDGYMTEEMAKSLIENVGAEQILKAKEMDYAVSDGFTFSEAQQKAYNKKVKSEAEGEDQAYLKGYVESLKKESIEAERKAQLDEKKTISSSISEKSLKFRDNAAAMRLSLDLKTKMMFSSDELGGISAFLTEENRKDMIELYKNDKKTFFELIEAQIVSIPHEVIMCENFNETWISDQRLDEMEQMSFAISAYDKLRKLNSGYAGNPKFDAWAKDVRFAVNKYRIKKLILSNPYYLEHTDKELYKDDPAGGEDKQFYKELKEAYYNTLSTEQVEALEKKARTIISTKKRMRLKASDYTKPANNEEILQKIHSQEGDDTRKPLLDKLEQHFTFGENGAYEGDMKTQYSFKDGEGKQVMGFNAELGRERRMYGAVDFMSDNEIIEMYEKIFFSRRKDYNINDKDMVAYAKQQYLEGIKMYSDMTLTLQSRLMRVVGNLQENISPTDFAEQTGEDFLNLNQWIQNINYNFDTPKSKGLNSILKENNMANLTDEEYKNRDQIGNLHTHSSSITAMYLVVKYDMNGGNEIVAPENMDFIKQQINSMVIGAIKSSRRNDHSKVKLDKKVDITNPGGQEYIKDLEEANKKLPKNSYRYLVNEAFINEYKAK